MTTAIYPGSFDPITVGHVELIERAALLFDQIVVVVGYNPNKQSVFSAEERVRFVTAATRHLENVVAEAFSQELLVSYARRRGATIIVRGLRSANDYAHEWAQAQMNRRMNPALDTLFLLASTDHRDISSTRVRQALKAGDPIDGLVPPAVAKLIAQSRL